MKNYFIHACICALAYFIVRDYLASIYVIGFCDGKATKLHPIQREGNVIKYPFVKREQAIEPEPAKEESNDATE